MTWGRLEFTDKHTGKNPTEIMRKWINNNTGAFPRTIEIQSVAKSEMNSFVNLALSFPIVSFEPMKGGELIAGCDCGFCAVYSRNSFTAKKVTSKDKVRADKFVNLVLNALSDHLGLALLPKEIAQFQKKHRHLNRSAMIVSYIFDLDKRTRFEVQSSEGLVLWRRLKKGPKFKITSEDYEEALAQLEKALIEFAKSIE